MRKDRSLLIGSLAAAFVALLFGSCFWTALTLRAPRSAHVSPWTIVTAGQDKPIMVTSLREDASTGHGAQRSF